MFVIRLSRGVTRYAPHFPDTLWAYPVNENFSYFFMSRVTPRDTDPAPRVSRCPRGVATYLSPRNTSLRR